MRPLLLVAIFTLTACPGPGPSDGGAGGGGTGGAGGGDPNATLQSLTVTPSGRTAGVGGTVQLTATGAYSDGSNRDVTAMATWSSSADAVATVSAAGLVTAVTEGTCDVIATFQGKTGQTGLTVSGFALTKLELAPGMADLGLGATQPFTATGTYFDMSTRNLSSQVTWSSSAPAVAPVSATGTVTAMSLGMTTLSASLDGITGSTPVTVSAKKLTSLAIAPRFISLVEGTTTQLTATGTYTDGTTGNVTGSVQWESLYPENATVDGGFVSAVMRSSGVSVFARSGVLSTRAIVSVTTAAFALQSITVQPTTMVVGEVSAGPRVDANFGGVGSNYFYVTWASSNPAVAKIDEFDRIVALSAGTSTLTVTTYNNAGPLTATSTLTVLEPQLQSITVSAGSSGTVTLAMGATLQLSATGVFTNNVLNKDLTSSVTWSSSNMGAVTVDAMGLARGVGAGTATITAQSGSVMGSVTVTVPSNAPPMQTAMLSPTDDNSVLFSGVSTMAENTAYPVSALFSTPGLAVGCSWLYNPPIGFAPEYISPLCGQALIKFDLSSLAGKTILSAKLRLTTKVYGVGYVPRRWFVYALATPWGPTVTWNTASSLQYYTYSQTQHDPPQYGGQVYELDQTQTVRNQVSGAYVNAGFELGPTNVLFPAISLTSLDAFEFHSKEDPGGRGPKLIVQYQ